ncbi:hypothetical protein FDUTEX481_09560 [Tolypothrix sp. PCC 7601]|nr:hypothetical protein FDUTEX481_09560 [Tolypothrix sp. PCC 7601]
MVFAWLQFLPTLALVLSDGIILKLLVLSLIFIVNEKCLFPIDFHNSANFPRRLAVYEGHKVE